MCPHFRSLAPRRSPTRFFLITSLVIFCVGAAPVVGAEEAPWVPFFRPVPEPVLRESASRIDPDSPGEILFREIDVTEGAKDTSWLEYVRLKIHRPAQVEELTRFSGDDLEGVVPAGFRAVLTLPDGTQREFGPDAIKERELARPGRGRAFLSRFFDEPDRSRREKFLVISGVEPGAVLDYQIKRRFDRRLAFLRLQSTRVPIRYARLRFSPRPEIYYQQHFHLLNPSIGNAELENVPAESRMYVIARNLPVLEEEPFQGPWRDRALVFHVGRMPREISVRDTGSKIVVRAERSKDGPWSAISSALASLSTKRCVVKGAVTAKLRELIQGVDAPRERARRIHEFCRQEYQEFRRQRPNSPGEASFNENETAEQVLNWRKNKRIQGESFCWLALALSRAAGLDCWVAAVPDRTSMRFDRGAVSLHQLETLVLATKLDGDWVFAMPHHPEPIPLGELPFAHEGQVALLGKAGPEEFVGVPFRPASESRRAITGSFELSAEGELTGQLECTFTGHLATTLRRELRGLLREARFATMAERLKDDTGLTGIRILELLHADAVGEPLVVRFVVRQSAFATVAGERLVWRAFPTQSASEPPFVAERRRGDVYFPFAWLESEHLTLQVPPGVTPETIPVMRPIKLGTELAYANRLQFDPATRTLQMRREMRVDDWLFDRSRYPALKRWFELAAAGDQQEVVFGRPVGAP